MQDKVHPPIPADTTLFENVIQWTMKPYWPSPNPTQKSGSAVDSPNEPIIPIQAFLHLVCSEWITMYCYISTRLSQLEWEISFPQEFLLEQAADSSLRKLHTWRRLVPLYHTMLSETLSHVFRFPSPSLSGNATTPYPFHALEPSFKHALDQIKELQTRLDRLTVIATSSITIADARASLRENRNVSRLTWLAAIFIPLTFITGLLSIQPDVTQLTESFKYYFAIALPLTVITVGVTIITTWKGDWIAKRLKGKAKKGKEKSKTKFTFYKNQL